MRTHTKDRFQKGEQEQRRLAQENAAIAEIGRIISSSLDIDEVYQRFVSEMTRLVSFDLVSVRLINPDDQSFVVAFTSGIDVPQRRVGTRLPLAGTLTEQALVARRSELFEEREHSTDRGSQVRFQAGLRSTIVAPLIARDKVLGSFTVSSLRARAYGEEELRLMEFLANQLAPAIENAQLYQKAVDAEAEQRRLAEENAIIAEIGRIISSSLDINEVYERFAVELKKLINLDRIVISTVNLDAAEFTITYHYGKQVFERSAGNTHSLLGTHLEAAVARRQSFIWEYAENATEPGDLARFNAGLRSGITVPLIVHGNAVGTMSAQCCMPGAYGERERAILEWLANYIAPAIQNAQLYEQTLVSEEKQRQLARETSTIAEVGRIISSSLNIDEVYGRFAIELKKLVDFDRVAVNVVDWETYQFRLTYHYGTSVRGRDLGVSIPLEGTHTEGTVTRNECIFSHFDQNSTNTGDIARFQAGLRSGITVPLVIRSKSVGVMSIQSCNPHAYGEREKVVLEKLANLVAPAIENAILYDEARRMGQELRRRADELARSNAELEQFAYVASHDLQEPLRSISGFTQLLARHVQDNLDDESSRLMDRITAATQRMQGLINDLLDYSRVGRTFNDFEGVDFESVLSQVVLNLEAAIEESGATVTHDPLPVVPADPSLIGQVLQNLIGNSIKFQGDEPPHIHISAREMEHEWLFSAKDNGIGISPQFKQRIFAIFQRLHTRDQYPGSGIGLAICKKAVERMGGRIWVESQSGQGSTFFFTIPKAARTQTSAITSPVNSGSLTTQHD